VPCAAEPLRAAAAPPGGDLSTLARAEPSPRHCVVVPCALRASSARERRALCSRLSPTACVVKLPYSPFDVSGPGVSGRCRAHSGHACIAWFLRFPHAEYPWQSQIQCVASRHVPGTGSPEPRADPFPRPIMLMW